MVLLSCPLVPDIMHKGASGKMQFVGNTENPTKQQKHITTHNKLLKLHKTQRGTLHKPLSTQFAPDALYRPSHTQFVLQLAFVTAAQSESAEHASFKAVNTSS